MVMSACGGGHLLRGRGRARSRSDEQKPVRWSSRDPREGAGGPDDASGRQELKGREACRAQGW